MPHLVSSHLKRAVEKVIFLGRTNTSTSRGFKWTTSISQCAQGVGNTECEVQRRRTRQDCCFTNRELGPGMRNPTAEHWLERNLLNNEQSYSPGRNDTENTTSRRVENVLCLRLEWIRGAPTGVVSGNELQQRKTL